MSQIDPTFGDHVVTTPAWLDALADLVKKCLTAEDFIGQVGYCWWEPGSPTNLDAERWLVAMYPLPVEVRGGPRDGGRAVSGFTLDVGTVTEWFSDIEELAWRMPVQYNNPLEGPEISLKGVFLGNPVWLRVFQLPPTDETASHVVDAASGRVWERPEDADDSDTD